MSVTTPWPAEAGGLALRTVDSVEGFTMVVPTARLLGRLPTLAAALDWRLGGRIAQRVAAERFTGQSGERLLLLLPEHPWPVVVLLDGPRLRPRDLLGEPCAGSLARRGPTRLARPRPRPQGGAPQRLSGFGLRVSGWWVYERSSPVGSGVVGAGDLRRVASARPERWRRPVVVAGRRWAWDLLPAPPTSGCTIRSSPRSWR